jgi:hypothetical protein
MTENQQPLPNDTDKLAATLAELERERERRLTAGTWSRTTLPILMAVVPEGEPEEVAQQRAMYAHLAEHPDAPKSVAAYDWMVIETVGPPPTVEPPNEFYVPDHDHAVDVTPRTPYRPPMPSSPPAPPPAMPKVRSNAGIPPEILALERRRLQRFLDGDWGDPSDGPIPYPRRNRTGW